MLGGERGRFRRWALIEGSWAPAPRAEQLCLGGARPNCSHLPRSHCCCPQSECRWPPRPESIPLGRWSKLLIPTAPPSGSLPSPPPLPRPSQPHSSSPLWWRPPHSSLSRPPLCVVPSPSPFSPLGERVPRSPHSPVFPLGLRRPRPPTPGSLPLSGPPADSAFLRSPVPLPSQSPIQPPSSDIASPPPQQGAEECSGHWVIVYGVGEPSGAFT